MGVVVANAGRVDLMDVWGEMVALLSSTNAKRKFHMKPLRTNRIQKLFSFLYSNFVKSTTDTTQKLRQGIYEGIIIQT